MTKEKWEEVKALIEEKFDIQEQYEEHIPQDEGGGMREVIEFSSPMGEMKVIRSEKPKLEGKKTMYSRRAGSQTNVEYVFSDTETVAFFQIFKMNDQTREWEEMQADSLF